MIPNLCIENGCFTKHPFINGCLGFQAPTILPFTSAKKPERPPTKGPHRGDVDATRAEKFEQLGTWPAPAESGFSSFQCWRRRRPRPRGCPPAFEWKKRSEMGVSKNRGTPKWMVYNWKTLLNWMIWGYHYFRKHPYGKCLCFFLVVAYLWCWWDFFFEFFFKSMSRWFKVTFLSPIVGGHDSPLKGSHELTIPKGHQQNCQG